MVQLIGKAWIAILLIAADFHGHATASPKSTLCTETGRFAHPDDCGKYIDCVPNGDGTFQERVKSCYGHPFSVEEQHCVEDSRAPSCTARSLRQGALRVPELDYLCQEGITSVCHNCKLAVDCLDGEAFPFPCDDAEVCDRNSLFGGAALCLPNVPSLTISPGCLCTVSTVEIKADPFNSTMYLFCSSDNQGIPETKYCGEGREYDEITKTCGSGTTCGPSPSFPNCTSMGTFVHPQNCSWGYTCLYNNGMWEVFTECCPKEGDIFDPVTGACASACTSLSEPFTVCTDVGIVIDPVDCTKYYACAVVGEPPVLQKTCPDGKQYSTTDNSCVLDCVRNPLSHCVRPDTC